MKEENLTPDAILKNYWDSAEEFADFCNAVLFDGEEIVHSHELADQNAASAVILEHGDHTKSFENFRDTIKIQKITGSDSTGLALLCVESQRYISYPCRCGSWNMMPVHTTINTTKTRRNTPAPALTG
ncbi:MAG: hypothetical protein LUI10_14385 [Lachnospiraceae bacterium]|nr:hypothetical protein [Lachnospiraceae bacterium]